MVVVSKKDSQSSPSSDNSGNSNSSSSSGDNSNPQSNNNSNLNPTADGAYDPSEWNDLPPDTPATNDPTPNSSSNSDSNSNSNSTSNSNTNDTSPPPSSGNSSDNSKGGNSNNNNSKSNNNGSSNHNNNSSSNGHNNNSSTSSSPSPPQPSSQNNEDDENPPPQSHKSPPSPKLSGRPTFSPPPPPIASHHSHKSTSATVNAGLIAGVVVGAGLLLLLLVLLIVFLCKKKNKEKHYATNKYFPDNKKGQQYYNGGKKQQHWNPGGNKKQDMNKYSGGTGKSSQQNWGPGMPPQPHNMSPDNAVKFSSGTTGLALPPPPMPPPIGFNKSTFTYEELAIATNGFSEANLIGQGGFGFVHKGVLPNGKEIAVKGLKLDSGQGEREFQAEVEIISRVHHRHLVSLVGYCISGGERMLVYEFISNNTLEHHLHGEDQPVMDFPTRMKIALGAAKGLAYLHEDCHPRIIHRDIKGANILIDDSYEAKVADFGLAKLSNDNFTHVSTRIMGTFGYLAPEYAASGKLTEKSDVFSFGVMLLELVTGKHPIDHSTEDEDNLVELSRPLIPRVLEEGIFEGLVDPRLEGKFDAQEMKRLIACAGAAIRETGKRRPRMSQIVRALEGDMSLDALNDPAKVRVASGGSSDYDTAHDMNRLRKAAVDSTDYASGSSGESSGLQMHPKPKA